METTTFIKSVSTENSGGNVMLDFVTLDDGHILVIDDYMVGYYESIESFENGDDPIKYFER
jgi:hypothetical protein